jgi:ketosteroid isomerase-like protein
MNRIRWQWRTFMAASVLICSLAGAQVRGEADPRVASDLEPAEHAETRIRAALADWRDAANSGDWRRAASHVAPGALIEFPGRPDLTYEQIMRNVDRPPEVVWRHDFEIQELLVDQRLAVMRVKFTSERAQPDGSWKPGETIMTLQVWRRQPDGQWRIYRTLSGKLADAARGG